MRNSDVRGALFVISGPAGVGKSVLAKRLLAEVPELARVVTSTSRPPRAGEVNAMDYNFFTEDEFVNKIEAGEFLEWVWFAGYRYGTLKATIDEALATGRSQLSVPDIYGAEVLRQNFPNVVSIFVVPPTFDALKERMIARNQNTPEQITEKLEIAKKEMEHQNEFSYVVVNDDLDSAVRELVAIVKKNT